jgi:ribonuclease P protein component
VLSVAKQFTLGKKERLKSRKQIERLFNEGKKFVVSPFRIFFLVHAQQAMDGKQSVLQLGVGVSGKNFKRAVDRNRIKRLTREAWRLQNKELKEKLKLSGRQLNVFFIYTGRELPEYKSLSGKVAIALNKLLEKTNENSAANS